MSNFAVNYLETLHSFLVGILVCSVASMNGTQSSVMEFTSHESEGNEYESWTRGYGVRCREVVTSNFEYLTTSNN